MNHLLAIDVGTSGTKACLYDCEGRICGRGYQSHALRLTASHLAEQDPQVWWRAAVTGTRIALAQAAGHATIDAISVSSTNALVLVDEAGLPVRPAILQLDQRAVADATSLADELGADIASITGNAVAGSGFWLPLLRWLQRHEKESINQASALLYPNGYVAQRLSGIASVDRTRAATTLLFDDTSSTWSERLTDTVGLSPSQLPRVCRATDVLGPLRKDAASLLGVRDGIPVIAGAMDSVAGALGLGLLEDGECALMLGTVARAGLLTSLGQRVSCTGAGPHSGIVKCPYPQSPLHWSMSASWGAGISLQWIVDTFYARRWDAIHLPQRPDVLGDLVARVPGPNAPGAVSGIGLTQGLTDIGHASVLAVLADLANHLDRLERACDRQARRVTACGRGARLLAPALAGLLGKAVEVPDDPETETRGGAILAATASGLFSNVAMAARSLAGRHSLCQPTADWGSYRRKIREALDIEYACERSTSVRRTGDKMRYYNAHSEKGPKMADKPTARVRDSLRLARYVLPTSIVYGTDALSQLPVLLSELGVSYPLIVTDRGLAGTPIPQRVTDLLSSAHIRHEVFAEVQPDPTTKVADEVAHMLRANGHDCVIGLGGGSSMDAAKAGAAGATSGLPVIKLVGPDKVSSDPLPVIAIPTTAGTGSEVTRFAVLTDNATETKVSLASLVIMPKFAVLDPSLTTGMPSALTATTGMDALAHAVESYGSIWNNPVSEGMALHAISLVGQHLRNATHNPGNMTARGGMLAASCIAELAANTTRLGLTHALAVALGATHHVPHGVGVAMLLGGMCSFNEAAEPVRYEQMIAALDADNDTMSDAVSALCDGLGLKARLRDFGVQPEDYDRIITLALKSDNVLANPRPAGPEELRELLRQVQ